MTTDDHDTEHMTDDERRLYHEWSAARVSVITFFEERGRTIGYFDDTDILIVDDMMASDLIEVETNDYSVVHPDFIDAFRRFLEEIPRFVVTLQVGYRGPYREDWPRMGLTLYRGKISDGLKRDYLPAPYSSYFYSNSRPDNRPDLAFV